MAAVAREVREGGMLDVVVLLTHDNLASTALGPIEVFHSAGTLWPALHHTPAKPGFRVTVASTDGKPVRTLYALSISPQCAIHDIDHADLIVVPASGFDLPLQFERHRALFPWLRTWHERGAYVAGICSGAAYLAEAGLLRGRRATTHWALAESYRARYPDVDWRPELFVTEDQRVLCSGGVYASIDLSLYLVEKFCGREAAVQCAKALLVDMPRSHQSGYGILPLSRPHTDERIRAAEEYMAENYARDLPVELLARHVAMSSRTFLRRFKAATGRLPGNYLQAQRMAIARTLLEGTSRPIQAIAGSVGYEDIAHFRKLFRRETGMTPGEYRRRFAI
jgi:transcriptional regulator GlxA family with amidase domain